MSDFCPNKDDLCADLRPDDFKKHDVRPHDDDFDHHLDRRVDKRRRKDRFIPIGRVTVDCSPVSFETPGQAKTILSCTAFEPVTCPITRVVDVPIPIGFGCVLTVPVVETFPVPCVVPVSQPPTLVPFPTLCCPQVVSPIVC